MPFQRDEKYAGEIGSAYGEYLTTYTSGNRQVHAYLFRKYDRVEAHVSLKPGFSASRVTDPYVSDLWTYAQQNNFADCFRIIMSSGQ